MSEQSSTPASDRPSPALSPALMGGFFMVAGLLTSAAVLFWFDPTQHAFYPQCLFHQLTGWNCPGCGTLRASHALLHGHILVALRDNLLFVCAIPFAAYHFFRHTVSWAAGRPLPMPKFRPIHLVALVGLLVIFAVLRNIPVAPFTLLSPAP